MDEEVHDQRGVLTERVHVGRRRVGQQEHVRLVDLLEATDGRPVEHQPVREDALAEVRRREGEVLHHPREVTEPDVDELDVVLLDVAEDLISVLEHAGCCLLDESGSVATYRTAPAGAPHVRWLPTAP